MRIQRISLSLLGVAGLCASTANAVVTYNDGATPLRLTSTPTGTFANSGWDLEGEYNGFAATAISSNYIVTAKHINSAAGLDFTINSQTYHADTRTDDPNSDLTVYHLTTAVPNSLIAAVYTGSSEVSKTMTVFGYGLPPGPTVTVANNTTGGWMYGTETANPVPLSWGSNVVTTTLNANTGAVDPNGTFLYYKFDPTSAAASTGATEGAVSAGDSGGGVFINDGGVWKLAGVTFGTEGPFSFTQGGQTFNADIFNGDGLWEGNQQVPVGYSAGSVATRLSNNMGFLAQFVPEPTMGLTIMGTAIVLIRRQRRA